VKRRWKQNDWIAVKSSAVRAVRYDPAEQRLDVRYSHGEEFEYGQVPRSKFRALLDAASIGTFVNQEIKPSHPCTKIPLEDL
jgi:hypothetical protein